MKKGFFENFKSMSPLNKQKIIANKSGGAESKPSLMENLPLTPLVDAFAILVIYLLLHQVAVPFEFDTTKGVKIPLAQATQVLEEGVKITIKNGQYFVENKRVSEKQLRTAIARVLKKADDKKIIVEADHKNSFSSISPIIVASSQLGIEKLQLAVRQGAE